MTYLLSVLIILIITVNLQFSETLNIDDDTNGENSNETSGAGMTGISTNNANHDSGLISPPSRIVPEMFQFFRLNITCLLQLCGSAIRNIRKPTCYCDKVCVVFGDCCADWYPEQFSNDESEMLKVMEHPEQWYSDNVVHTEDFDLVADFIRYSKCMQMTNGSKVVVIRVISMCPGTYAGDEISQKCDAGVLHPLQNIPVSLDTNSSIQIVFKNRFCALCHGYRKQEVTSWKVTAKCMTGDKLSESCLFTMVPPDVGKLRYCPVISRGNENGCDDSELDYNGTLSTICKSYVAPLYSYGSYTKYANPHCGVCSVGSIFPSVCHVFTGGVGTNGQGLNMLFQFKFNANTGSWNTPEHEYCQEAETWYPDKDGCYPLTCPRNTQPTYGQCVDDPFAIYNSTNNLPLDRHGEMQYKISIFLYFNITKRNNSAVQNFLELVVQRLITSHVVIVSEFEMTTAHVSPSSSGSLPSVYRMDIDGVLDGTLATVIEVTTQEIYDFKIKNSIGVYAQIRNFDDKDLLSCTNVDVTSFAQFEFYVIDSTIWLIRPRDTNITIKVANARYDMLINNTSTIIPNFKYIGYCKEHIYLDCPLLSYATNEYELKDSKAYVNTSEGFIRYFQVYDGILYVCDNLTMEWDMLIGGDETMQIVTIVMLSLSIISLLALLVTHCAIPSLKTLHGKNLMSFSTSLLIAQCLFITGSYVNGTLCNVASVMQHYFWLCAFMWNSVMAFDLVRKFSAATMMKIGNGNTVSRYRKYFLIAHGFPLLVIGVCIAIDNAAIASVSVGYGPAGGYCWIGNPVAALVAFIVPVGICLLFNIVCFAIALHGIQGAKNISKNVRNKKQDRNYCFVYTKISLLLGVTWIVGFISGAVHFEPLLYINICLNGLQGFFIFLGFIVNTRIRGLIRQKTKTSFSVSELTDISHVTERSSNHV